MESGPDGQSGLQIQYVPKSTGNLDVDESKHIYESPMKTHSDKNLSSKATPKAIIDASDESSGEVENLKSKVVQKERDSEPPHEGLGITLNDMIQKDIKRRSSLEEVGPNEAKCAEKKISGGPSLGISFAESPIMGLSESQATALGSPIAHGFQGNQSGDMMQINLCAGPK